MSLKQLLETRAQVAATIRTLADRANAEKKAFLPEEEMQWQRANADYDALGQRKDAIERADAIGREQRQPLHATRDLPGREDYDGRQDGELRDIVGDALGAWLKPDGRHVTERHSDACRQMNIDPRAPEVSFRLASTPQFRAMQRAARTASGLSGVTGSAGAYTIAEGFVANLERAQLAFNGVLQACGVLRTESGNPMSWPTSDDTDIEGELLPGNTATADDAANDPSFGAVTFNAYLLSSKLIRCPVSLLEDAGVDLGSELGTMLGERLGRIGERLCTVGTGSSQPFGIVTASTLGTTTASATAIKSDELLDLIHSVDSAYADAPTAGFMLNRAVMLYIRKLKDGNGRYLWESALTSAEPDRLLGHRYFTNAHMTSTLSAGAKSVVFGDLNRFKVRLVRRVRLLRLVERYAEYDQTGFLAFNRLDSAMLDAGTHPVRHLLQAS